MFGWFKQQPRCPVSAQLRRWTEYRMAWLVDQFGMDRLNATQVILPTPEFFPEPYSPTPEGARNLLDRVSRYMGANPNQLDLEYYSGLVDSYQRDSKSTKICLDVTDVEDPVPVIVVMAHQVARHILIGEQRITIDAEDVEPLSGLLSIFLGFGVFVTSALLRESRYTSGHWHYSKWRRVGYLPLPVCAYALAIFARNRQTNGHWVDYLGADARQPFQEGVRFLESSGLSGLTRTEPCEFYSSDNPAPGLYPAVAEHEHSINPVLPTIPTAAEAGDEPNESGSVFEDASDEGSADAYDDDSADAFDEDSADALAGTFTRGVVLASQHNYDEAIAAFNKVLQCNPFDMEGYLSRSACYRQLGRLGESLTDADRAVRLDPQDWIPRRNRAETYFRLGKFPETIEDCDFVLHARGDDPGTYHLRGRAHAAQGDHERAVKDFGRAIRHNPKKAAYYRDRAVSLERLANYEAAERDRDEAVRRDPFSMQSE